MNGDNFVDALLKVATQFQIPMGIEWSENASTAQKISESWTDADVQQVIQRLVNAQRGYEFEVKDGVVHVFPEWAKSSQQDFVNLKVQKFIVRNEVAAAATRQLRDLVKLTVSPPPQTGATAGGTAGSQLGTIEDREISLKLENLTVRDALDQIALVSDRKIWVVTFTEEPLLTPTGFRRTRSLWIDTVPDNEQPVWNTLRWGDAIPPTKPSLPRSLTR
jgi:hypothetical protein